MRRGILPNEWRLLLLLAACSVLPAAEPDLKSMDLEQLMNIRVTSVQRKEQTVSLSAASVTVITRDEIRRMGVSSLPEALRLAPGLHVARVDSGSWAIGARGFNGQFANKLLVLVDGQSRYHPLNSGVFWDGLDVMLDDVERIEVIRGPGAVMWGANAVNGVINIITRRAEDTLGGYAEAGTGTEDRALGRFRWGQRWKEGLAWRISGQYGRREKLNGGTGPVDEAPWVSGRLTFRLDWDRGNAERLELHADLMQSSFGEYYGLPALTPSGRATIPSEMISSGGSMMGLWSRPMKGGLTTMQFSYWHLQVNRTSQVRATLHVADVDVQHRRRWHDRHELVLGAGMRGIQDHSTGSFTARFDPASASYYTAQATLLDEWEVVRNRLFLSGGFRAEQNKLSGANFQPTVRALWSLGPKISVWGAVSRAVRTPSRSDLDLSVNVDAVTTPFGQAIVRRRPAASFTSEKQRSFELGYRHGMGRVSWDLAAFWNQYRDYAGIAPSGFGFDGAMLVPLAYVDIGNFVQGHGLGMEVSAHLDVTRKWRLGGTLTQYRSKLRPKQEYAARPGLEVVPDVFPSTQGMLLSSYQLGRRWQVNAAWFGTGDLNGRRLIGRHQRLDANAQWRVSEWGGASFGVQNLLGAKLYEFAPEDGSTSDPMGRTLFVRWQWWF